MMNTAVENINEIPEYAYHLLRAALEKFQTNIPSLSDSQYAQAKNVADKTFALESLVLSTSEAGDTLIPESKLKQALQAVAERYNDHETYLQDLKINGLDEAVLRIALYRELVFDVVMDRVSASATLITDVDVQLFYQLCRDRFSKPEKRKVRHILITINPDFSENNRDSASLRIYALAKKLKKNPSRFGDLARKNSECPTAIDGGVLGELARGTLYPELDAELFSLTEGEVSSVIETEMGFHILFCEKIYKSVIVPFSHAKEKIEKILEERQRKSCQKAWLQKCQQEQMPADIKA